MLAARTTNADTHNEITFPYQWVEMRSGYVDSQNDDVRLSFKALRYTSLDVSPGLNSQLLYRDPTLKLQLVCG